MAVDALRLCSACCAHFVVGRDNITSTPPIVLINRNLQLTVTSAEQRDQKYPRPSRGGFTQEGDT